MPSTLQGSRSAPGPRCGPALASLRCGNLISTTTSQRAHKALSDGRRGPSAAVDRAGGSGRADPVAHQCRNPHHGSTDRGPDTVVAAEQLQSGAQVRHVGQMRQLMLVAGPQPQQVGVDRFAVAVRSFTSRSRYSVSTRRSAAWPVIGRTGGKASSRAVMRAIATASTGSVLPWPGPLNPSREVIKGGTSTTFRSHSSR